MSTTKDREIDILKAKLVKPGSKKKQGWNMEITYSERTLDGTSIHAVECHTNPHIDLVNAFQKLSPHLATLTSQYDEDGGLATKSIEVRGFSIKDEDDENKDGVTITGQRTVLSDRSITVNSPFLKWRDADDVIKEARALAQDIEECKQEVREYLFNGKKTPDSQGELPLT